MTDHDPRVLAPGFAPTPFSAEEIRTGCPPGRTITLLVERPGAVPVTQVTRFVTADDHGADHEVTQFVNGEPLGDPVVRRSTWEEFQSHASFPEAATQIDDVTLDISAGRFACLRYTVTGSDGANTFWFAKELPGMPIKVQMTERDTIVYTMTMLTNEP